MPNNRRAKEERSELSNLDSVALQSELVSARKALWESRFALGKRQLEKTADIQKTRKRIARILTYMGRQSDQGAQG